VPAVARWAALVGHIKKVCLETALKGISGGGESLSRGKPFQTVGAK